MYPPVQFADSAIWEKSNTTFQQPVGRGTNVTLTCEVCANPSPTIEWYFEEDTTSLTTGENLTLTNIQNYGNYTCVASNTVQGQVYTESFTYSLVLGPGPPGPVVNLSVINVTSVSVSLQWTSSWDGDMTASFMLQYREIDSSEYIVAESGINWVDPDNYITTTVTSLSADTEYEFSVTTENSYNGVSSSYAVTITSKTYGRFIRLACYYVQNFKRMFTYKIRSKHVLVKITTFDTRILLVIPPY